MFTPVQETGRAKLPVFVDRFLTDVRTLGINETKITIKDTTIDMTFESMVTKNQISKKSVLSIKYY